MSPLAKAKQHMHNDIAISSIEDGIERKLQSEGCSKSDRLVAELAKMQLDHVRELVSNGIVTEEDLVEVIYNPEKTKQILGNT